MRQGHRIAPFIEESAILARGPRQIPSAASLRRCDPFAETPVLEQASAAQWIPRLERLAGGDAVGAEMAESLPQFAPSYNDARLIKISDAERPDRAFSLRALRVTIVQHELAFSADGGANWREVERGSA